MKLSFDFELSIGLVASGIDTKIIKNVELNSKHIFQVMSTSKKGLIVNTNKAPNFNHYYYVERTNEIILTSESQLKINVDLYNQVVALETSRIIFSRDKESYDSRKKYEISYRWSNCRYNQ